MEEGRGDDVLARALQKSRVERERELDDMLWESRMWWLATLSVHN
jgi:hypothetical protein